MASLIYHAGALGDFITALPAIARWREEHPGEPQVLLGKPEHAAIAPPFDETWDIDAGVFSGLFSGSAASDFPLAERLRPVVSALLFAAPASPIAATLARLGVGEVVRQDPFPASRIHVVDYHLSLFPGGLGGKERVPRIRIPEPAEERDLGDVAAIHPGSGSAKKNWPLDRFIELAARLVERDIRISWIVGPADAGITLVHQDVNVSGAVWKSLPLPVLAARLGCCRLFVGNDSGVTHLAAAAGCPTVALFGESDRHVWAPRGPRVKVIGSRNDGMKAIGLEDVFQVCVDLLDEK